MGSIRMYAMVKDMLKHVYNMNEMSLSDMLEIAFEIYPVRVVCSDIIAPMMAEIGSMWERGELMVVMEHFASNIIIAKLKAMLHKQNTTTNKNGPTVFVGCAPDEFHEIGALIVAFFMSVNGWKVVYLGQNIPLTDVYNIVDTMTVHTIALSASNERSLGALQAIGAHIASRAKLKKIEFLIGGRLLCSVPNVLSTIQAATTRNPEDLYSYTPPTHVTHSDSMIRGALDGSYSLIKESYRKMRLANERRKRTQYLLDQITAEVGEEGLLEGYNTGKDGETCESENGEGWENDESNRNLEETIKQLSLDDKRKVLELRIERQRKQTTAIREKLQKYKEDKGAVANKNFTNRLVSGKFVPKQQQEQDEEKDKGEEKDEGQGHSHTPAVKYTPPVDGNRLIAQPRKPEPVTRIIHLNKPLEPSFYPAFPSSSSFHSTSPVKFARDPIDAYYPRYANMPMVEMNSSDSGSTSSGDDEGTVSSPPSPRLSTPISTSPRPSRPSSASPTPMSTSPTPTSTSPTSTSPTPISPSCASPTPATEWEER